MFPGTYRVILVLKPVSCYFGGWNSTMLYQVPYQSLEAVDLSLAWMMNLEVSNEANTDIFLVPLF